MSTSPRVHPTALIAPEAELAADVQVGPYAVLEGPVRLGPACTVGPFAHLIGPLTMGCHNQVFSGAVLGERPQHLKYNGEPTRVEVGEHNIFREHVTVHRGTTHSRVTRIGSHNFLMAGAHVAHDCVIGDRCILANGALLGGHVVLGDGVLISGNAGVHQFMRVGRLALLGGVSMATKDVPPFVIVQQVNRVRSVNVIGMRRAGIPAADIDAMRKAFRVVYRQALALPNSLAQVERELGHVGPVAEFVAFVRASQRGIALQTEPGQAEAA